jgi:hypothetical protein
MPLRNRCGMDSLLGALSRKLLPGWIFHGFLAWYYGKTIARS